MVLVQTLVAWAACIAQGTSFVEALAADSTHPLAVLSVVLGGVALAVGDFSAADTMLGHACIMSKRLGIVTDEAFPNLSAYADRLMTRPACAKAFSA